MVIGSVPCARYVSHLKLKIGAGTILAVVRLGNKEPKKPPRKSSDADTSSAAPSGWWTPRARSPEPSPRVPGSGGAAAEVKAVVSPSEVTTEKATE